MKRKSGTSLTLAVMALSAILLPVHPSLGESTSPGKNAAFESSDFGATGDIPPASGGPLLTATIAKGKKKRVLAMEATLTSGTGGSPPGDGYTMGVAVNGVEVGPIDPGGFTLRDHPCPDSRCTFTSSWWFDIDAAEASNPGQFVNQPLTIILFGGDSGGVQSRATVTMSVRMEKK